MGEGQYQEGRHDSSISTDATGAAREAGRRLALGTLEYVGSRDAVIPEDDVSGKGTVARQPRRCTEERL